MSRRLIDRDELISTLKKHRIFYVSAWGSFSKLPEKEKARVDEVTACIAELINAPTVDAVPVEKYNDLREAFVDFVCSGVPNPAPYCKNRCEECVDGRGWCTYRRCNGFNPDGERQSDL